MIERRLWSSRPSGMPGTTVTATEPPAVLLSVGGLTLLRTLGLARIPVIVAASNPNSLSFRSVYCTGRYILRAGASAEETVDSLLALGQRLSAQYGARIPLYFGNDDNLALVSRHRRLLEQDFAFIINDEDVTDTLLDKEKFQRFAAERQLPVPRCFGLESLASLDFPVLIKPKSKIGWHGSQLFSEIFRHSEKACIFASGDELSDRRLKSELWGSLILQEYIPGDDRSLYSFHGFSDEEGRLLGGFTGRKIRTYPAHIGESAFIELVNDPELFELGRRIAETIPLKGAFKIDLKKHADTGEYYLLEINTRFNLWHYLGAMNGLNLPRIAYDYLVHGARPQHVTPTAHVRWLHFGLDWRACQEMSSRGEIGLLSWAWSLLSTAKIYQIFSWRDPMPWVAHWQANLGRLRGRIRRSLKWQPTG
jgi:D-aspartate ligase